MRSSAFGNHHSLKILIKEDKTGTDLVLADGWHNGDRQHQDTKPNAKRAMTTTLPLTVFIEGLEE